jgi:thiamine transporter
MKTRITDLLGCQYPVIQGGMAWVAEYHLAAAVSEAGGIGLIGYWYGPYVGLMTAVAYGLVQFVMEPIFYTVPQMILDYPLAFGALGLAGFFANKKHGLQIGYIVAVFGRYVFAVISGVVFFGAYAPEGTPAIVYSVTYNATYIVPEAIATLIVISLPPVAKALAQVKKNALSA